MSSAGQAVGRVVGDLSPARRAALVAGAVALALVGWLAWGWFRESALVQVRHVEIQGVSGRDAPEIRRALEEAGRGMTTLHVREDDLRRSVSPYASVRSLSVSTNFPSTLHISVDQRRAVAVLVAGKRRVAVAADGTVLAGAPADKLPTLPTGSVPSNGRLTGKQAVFARVLGAAPPRVLPLFDRIWLAPDGIRLVLHEGAVIRFGSADRLRAKWAAATRLLAARATVGAKVMDVRLPERPSAQFTDSSADTSSTSPTEQGTVAATATTAGTTTSATTTTAGTAAPATTTTEATNPQP